MSTDPTTKIAGLEPTYSAREAAALLGRSYSWLDQRLRHGEFMKPDGTVVRPLRSAGGYRYLTFEMLKDIAACCYRHHWFSYKEVRSILFELATDAHREAGEHEGPG